MQVSFVGVGMDSLTLDPHGVLGNRTHQLMTPFRPMRKQGLREDLGQSQKPELEPRASVSQSCADPPSPQPLNQSPRT